MLMNSIASFFTTHILNYNILVMSSMLFFVPACIAYNNELYIHCAITNITAIISMHNWWQFRYTNISTTVDVYFCKILFLLYFISGLLLVESIVLRICGFIMSLNIVSLYTTSCRIKELKLESNLIHFLFHLCTIVAMLIVVSGL